MYSGEWKDGMRHGQGTFKFANGDEHLGEWKGGKLHDRILTLPASPGKKD